MGDNLLLFEKKEGDGTISSINRTLLNAASRIDDLLRDTVSRRDFPDVILPCILLRRLECVLEPTREEVRMAIARGMTDDAQLTKIAGVPFYNTSLYDFPRLCGGTVSLRETMRLYLAGWSPNIRVLLAAFRFESMLKQLDEGNLLPLLVRQLAELDLHPGTVAPQDISVLFEELLRQCFRSASFAGEYFSPPEVADLIAQLLLESDGSLLREQNVTVYDPCCGTGRLLFAFRDAVQKWCPDRHVILYGQELNPQSLALCQAELYMSTIPDAAERMVQGSTLAEDRYADRPFCYIVANPPYGKSWVTDQASVMAEAKRGEHGRFSAGIPKVSDGQMLFLQHVIAHMLPAEEGGSRIGIIMNGSPLFQGNAGGGESEIRRWILENDWLDAIIALPEALFYNTGISTYIWILTNCKSECRRSKIQCIDARDMWMPMRRNAGEKRREISDEHRAQIVSLYCAFEENNHSKILTTSAFGYRRITVEHPLRCSYQVPQERIVAVCAQQNIQNLVETSVRRQKRDLSPQAVLQALLKSLPDQRYRRKETFERDLVLGAQTLGFPLSSRLRDALLRAFSERDETAEICYDSQGYPEPDPELRETERVPLSESIWTFFERVVRPYAPDAWINEQICDHKDHQVGLIGYEINFTRLFYHYQPTRPLEVIAAEIEAIEAITSQLLHDLLADWTLISKEKVEEP